MLFRSTAGGHAIVASRLAGVTGLTKTGSGRLTLSGSNPLSGPIVVAEGTLALGAGGAAGSVAGPITVAAAATLAVNRSDAVILTTPISGSGGLTQMGAGATTLAELGNPLVDTRYAVCVWDDVAGVPTLLMEMNVPAGGMCRKRSCWRLVGRDRGYGYKNRDHTPAGIEALLASRAQLVAYVRRRVNDPDLAEDIVHDGLLRALRAAPALRDRERLLPWFYQVLRNAVVDEYRRRDVERQIGRAHV